MTDPYRFTDYPHVTFTARCPGCAADVVWVAALVSVPHELTAGPAAGVAYRIDCAACDIALEAAA